VWSSHLFHRRRPQRSATGLRHWRLSLTLKDLARESALLRSRLVIAMALAFVLAGILMVRLIQLQVLNHEHFQTLSHTNRVKVVPVAPTRGLIFDRNGVVLAQNKPYHSLEIIPEAVPDLDATLAALKTIVAIAESDEQRFYERLKGKRRFQSVPLRLQLSEEEVARFAVNRHRFPGVDVQARLAREYPLGPLGVHVIGYVARISERELRRVDAANYRGTDHIGKVGVEQAYETVLHGRVGHQHAEINAQGRTLRILSRAAPVPGKNLYLSIDASLQAAAERALGSESGAVVAIDPQTGDVLAMASMPSFDPNLFVNGIDAKAYDKLRSSADRPLFNRALHGQYPPGSTIKPFLALAALAGDYETVRKEMWCPGWYRLKGRAHLYRDWKRGGHGSVDLERAIVESCDVYFYELAINLGIEHIHNFMQGFGFGVATGIDLPGEAPGLMPSPSWKRAHRNEVWFPGETLITGIGQGFTLATPLQLASAVASLSVRGRRPRPHVVDRIVDPINGNVETLPPVLLPSVQIAEPKHWDRVLRAMVNVVHGAKGTARRAGLGANYRMGGKTGTAQVFGVAQNEEYDEEKIDKKLRDHGLFIAFAPADEPKLAVAVVVENGGSGSSSAAPVAREVIDHYLNHLPPQPPVNGTLVSGYQAAKRADLRAASPAARHAPSFPLEGGVSRRQLGNG
jgi:penicillin-binding protein 2